MISCFLCAELNKREKLRKNREYALFKKEEGIVGTTLDLREETKRSG